MSTTSLYALLLTSVATSFFHTLIPDHWLPFVLFGRARGWSSMRAATVSGFSALLHVVFSALLAVMALRIGDTAAASIGESLEHAGAVMLVLFGGLYAWWAWRKGGHFHPGGSLLHQSGESPGCGGAEGPDNPDHLHYHADDDLIRGRSGWGDLALAAIVGANPCVLLLPLVLSAAGRGASAIWLVLLAYGLPTVLLMVSLSVLGVSRGLPRVPWLARRMELMSGLLLVGLGLLFLWLH